MACLLHRIAKMAEFGSRWPLVSVFVPARDEENSIEPCLSALLAQDYLGEFEILFADDDSKDQTLAIAKEISLRGSRLQVFQVEAESGPIFGKQLALAQLTERGKGEIFLFCDADTIMPKCWISKMVEAISRLDCDLLNGTTCTNLDSIFNALQAIDWLIPQAVMSELCKIGIAYTAMGNNMAITRIAYDSIGGYRGIPFSMTEDYALFSQAKKNGYTLQHFYHLDVLGITQGNPTVKSWFVQHLRWTNGFRKLPFQMRLPVYLNILLLPAFLFFVFGTNFGNWKLVFGTAWLMRLGFNAFAVLRMGKPSLLAFLLPYEILYSISYAALFVTSFFRKEIYWKGRKITNL